MWFHPFWGGPGGVFGVGGWSLFRGDQYMRAENPASVVAGFGWGAVAMSARFGCSPVVRSVGRVGSFTLQGGDLSLASGVAAGERACQASLVPHGCKVGELFGSGVSFLVGAVFALEVE